MGEKRKKHFADPPDLQGIPAVIRVNTNADDDSQENCYNYATSKHQNATTTHDNKISLTPGENWINRQTASEIQSLSWSSDDETKDIISQILLLLRQKQCLGCFHITMIILSTITFLSLYAEYGHTILYKIGLGATLLVQVLSLVRLSSLEKELNKLFLQFRITKIQRQEEQSGDGDSTKILQVERDDNWITKAVKIEHQQKIFGDSRKIVRVEPDDNWITRHTEQEIMSLSWDEADLPDVVLLLEKRKLYTNLHGLVSLSLFILLFVYLFGRSFLNLVTTFFLVLLLFALFLVSVYISLLTGRLIKTFQKKFDERFRSSIECDYVGEEIQSVA